MAGPKLTLYLDTVSPFAYMAFHIVKNSETFKSCDVTFVPVFLGGIMKTTGNKPPLTVKKKRPFQMTHAAHRAGKAVWIEEERRRWASIFSIPIADRAPDNFPVNTIAVQRALVAISRDQPAQLVPAMTACYNAFWVERNEGNVAGEGLGKVLASVLGQDGAQKVLQASKSDEIKQLLNKTTQEAVDAGSFGLPYFVATNSKGKTEAYWGVDHMGMLIDHLGLERSKLGGRYQAML